MLYLEPIHFSTTAKRGSMVKPHFFGAYENGLSAPAATPLRQGQQTKTPGVLVTRRALLRPECSTRSSERPGQASLARFYQMETPR